MSSRISDRLPMPILTMQHILNFWDKVEKTDSCWNWIGGKTGKCNHGRLGIHSKLYLASRISWWLHYNEDPGDLEVCHKCNNGACVNPDHLFLGSQSDNVIHAVDCGLINHQGILHPRSQLTEEQVYKIRELRYTKSAAAIAKQFKVGRSTINHIFHRTSWNHI